MKKINLLLVLLLLAPLLAAAQYSQWQEVAPPPVLGGAFTINKTNNYFYLGSYNDGIYRSTNAGASWQRVHYGPTDKTYYAIAVRQTDGAVFAGGIGAMYRSLDHGTTWTKHDLPTTAAVTHIAFNSAGDIVIGTQDLITNTPWPSTSAGAGVWKAAANSTTWAELNTGLEGTSKAIAALRITHNDRIFIGVHDGEMDETGGVYTLGSSESSWQKKPLTVSYSNFTRTVTAYKIFDLALDGMGGLYVAAEGVSAVTGVPARVACRVLAKSTDEGATWQAASVVSDPANYDLEPVPEVLFMAGSSSFWTSTLIGHISGNSGVSGIYLNPESTGWSRVDNAQVFTNFKLCFAEDAEGTIYAMEDSNAKLFKSSRVTSSEDELPLLGLQTYPNPATDRLTTTFSLPSAAAVQVTVSDVLGRQVAQLVNTNLQAGSHSYTWQPNENPAGTYFVKLQLANKSQVLKVMVVK